MKKVDSFMENFLITYQTIKLMGAMVTTLKAIVFSLTTSSGLKWHQYLLSCISMILEKLKAPKVETFLQEVWEPLMSYASYILHL